MDLMCMALPAAKVGSAFPRAVCNGHGHATRNMPGITRPQTIHSLPRKTSTMLVSLTVGKVDAGVAVLLTEDKRLVGTCCRPPSLPLCRRIPAIHRVADAC